MYYEIYIDSLFMLQFFMNLYLLAIVNHVLYRTANLRRLLVGAFLGALCYMAPLFFSLKLYWSVLFGSALAIICMSFFVFRCYSRQQLWKVLEKMILVSMLMGGTMILVIRMLPTDHNVFSGLVRVLGLGCVAGGFAYKLLRGYNGEEVICTVLLKHGETSISLKGILDTGNSLVEPISQKPVAVLGEEMLGSIMPKEQREYFRVIPYRSVGKQQGFLKGYLLDEMVIEIRGGRKVCKKVYIAECKEFETKNSDYELIINPQILQIRE